MLDIGSGESQIKWIAYKPQNDEWQYNEGEISEEAISAFIFDHESIKLGWGKIQRGVAPEYKWQNDLKIKEPAPGETGPDGWNRAISVDCYFKSEHMQGVYNWSTITKGALQGINNIYADIFGHDESKNGKLAVLKYTGSTETDWRSRIPNFEIIKWVDRPEDWEEQSVEEPKPVEEEKEDDLPF
tara:strand:- start:3667 stop:4221 length:555 start_codon:yes stop_codon:yes gene_type:complete